MTRPTSRFARRTADPAAAAFRRYYEAWANAATTDDRGWFDATFADDFRGLLFGTGADGAPYRALLDKAQYVDLEMSIAAPYIRIFDVSARVHGALAVSTIRAFTQATVVHRALLAEPAFPAELLADLERGVTCVLSSSWRCDGRAWQCTAHQVVRSVRRRD